jgi:class 3 adenylate cyclase/tetratricopeptide (TPR) repeat protein
VRFDDILDQVIALLKRQGRVSYGAMKRRFDLDDAYLEDLKGEILFAYPVVDEDGRGLVWTGEPLLTAPPLPDAARRQLTVMFCDVVDSTKLSGRLDPEEYREVLRAYQSACVEAIQRFDGYIAQHLGDGLLVYFGFPTAHEDDAQRAILAGLGMLDAMQTLNARLGQEHGIRLNIRVGIHTGLTVIGDIGAGQKHELLALGEAPNIAAGIQSLAAPDMVAISTDTYRLVEGYFTVEDLGRQTLRGVADPLQVYRVLRHSGAQSRLDVASMHGLTPLVGREQEVGLLLERWHWVKEGQGQVVLLSGDAGIGKSRLVQVLKDHITTEPHTRLECRSSPHYQHSALYPIIDLLHRLLQWQHNTSPEEQLDTLAQALSQYRLPVQETIPLLAPLLSFPLPADRYPPLTFSPQRQRQKTLEILLAMLLGWAMVERGEGEAGIARIEAGIAAWQATGAKALSAVWLGLLAEAYGKIGQIEEGLAVVVDALQAVKNTGEHFYEAELQRLRGEFLLQLSSDNQREAEACFQHAMTIAQAQGAKAWELRTATSLARLWQHQGNVLEARDLLEPVYNWFTEGFYTADLQEAKASLDELL